MAGVGTRSRKRTASSSSSKQTTKKAKKASSSSSNSKNTKMWSSKSKNSSKKASAVEAQAEAMFQELVQDAHEEDPDTLSMEGIALMGEKLGLDVETDLRILVLLWKMQASKPGALTKDEWMKAAKSGTVTVTPNGWDSIIAEQLPGLDIGFLADTEFKDFYKFCFQFNRQGTFRTLDLDLVVALLRLVLKDRVTQDRLNSFCEFLESLGGSGSDEQAAENGNVAAQASAASTKQNQYNRITLDQWTSFWDFCVECEDLNNYDESSSAWPVLIDEYVEYMAAKMKK